MRRPGLNSRKPTRKSDWRPVLTAQAVCQAEENMIYTVTLNPSLDYVVTVDNFRTGITNRTSSEQIYPGGKGLNVSAVLKNLGIESTAFGFIAGFTGEKIREMVCDAGITAEFITLEQGMSRINLKLKSIDGTEINGTGPEIPEKERERLMERLSVLETGDTLVLAGSIPPSVPGKFYCEVLRALSGKDIHVVVDASGDALRRTLPLHPFLIKPNHQELGELFRMTISSRKEVLPYAGKLQELGAENVLVSLAGEGAVLLDADGNFHQAPAPEGTLVNGVGAGDSMIAGFLAGWQRTKDYDYAFRMALAAGSATAFSESLAQKKEVEALFGRVSTAVYL